MLCQRCGAVNENGDQFCGHCGNLLKVTPPEGNPAGDQPVYPAAYPAPLPFPRKAAPNPSPSPATVYPQGAANLQAPTVAVTPPGQPSWRVDPSAEGNVWMPRSVGRYAASPYANYTVATQPTARSRKRRRRWPWTLLLVLIILGSAAAGSWILFLRPAAHQSVDDEIHQGLLQAVNQVPLDAAQSAPAGFPVPIPEDQINSYIAAHSSALTPITAMQVSLQPGVMVVNFQAYGLGSTVRFGLEVQNHQLVAQDVQVSGLLSWVESADELTPRLNEALSQVDTNLGRQIDSVSIDEGVMRLVFA